MSKEIDYYFITKSNEYSSDRIIDWFLYNNININRCNTDDFSTKKISLDTRDSRVKILFRKFKYCKINEYPQELSNFLSKEISGFWFELLDRLKKQIVFGHHKCEEPPRIDTLENAKKCGLQVPNYLIASSKSDLIEFIKKNPKIICKSIHAPQNFIFNEIDYGFRTANINTDDIYNLSEEFYPTYFQEKIKRDIEVRIFYLNRKSWGMAYFIKKENDISADIGNISKRREVPIKIPIEIDRKLIEFMESSGYNTGSIDFIVAGDKWYFLELNPAGQYDFVSKRCNYFLDREIFKVATNER